MAKEKNLTKKQKRLRRKRRRRRILFGLEIIILLLLVVGLFVVAKMGKMNFTELNFENIGINTGVAENKVMKGYTTIGLVGLDNRQGSLKQGNSDTMIIASINNDTKKVKLYPFYLVTNLRSVEVKEGIGKNVKAIPLYPLGGIDQYLLIPIPNLDLNLTDF